jgi:hypothetical protein
MRLQAEAAEVEAAEAAEAAQAQAERQQAAADWEELFDETHQPYYHNTATGLTQWDPPE